MKLEIKHRFSGEVLFSLETDSWKVCLEAAVKSGANLLGANLWGANLESANLRGANLWGANLESANLRGANLLGANLWGANLESANLLGANLWGANLESANLWGEKLTKSPLQILGLKWFVMMTTKQIQIGCQIHPAKKWAAFTDEEISAMHSDALEFWNTHKAVILGLQKVHAEEK